MKLKVELEIIQDEHMLKDFTSAMRGGICGVMAKRYFNINSQSQSQGHSHSQSQTKVIVKIKFKIKVKVKVKDL